MKLQTVSLTAVLALSALVVGCSSNERPQADAVEPGDDTTDNGSNGAAPHPRWVLYDGDGNPVDAIVSPAQFEPALPETPVGEQFDPEAAEPTCFSTRVRGQRRLRWTSYSLESGELAPCTRDLRTYNIIYRNSDCTREGTETLVRASNSSVLRKWRGQIVWPEGRVRAIDQAYREGPDGSCNEARGVDAVIPVKQVPGVYRAVFDNPPYSLEVHY